MKIKIFAFLFCDFNNAILWHQKYTLKLSELAVMEVSIVNGQSDGILLEGGNIFTSFRLEIDFFFVHVAVAVAFFLYFLF